MEIRLINDSSVAQISPSELRLISPLRSSPTREVPTTGGCGVTGDLHCVGANGYVEPTPCRNPLDSDFVAFMCGPDGLRSFLGFFCSFESSLAADFFCGIFSL